MPGTDAISSTLAERIWRVDPSKCDGCGLCIEKCREKHKLSRLIEIPDKKKDAGVRVSKCDLCADAPFHWSKQGGGAAGKQACVEVCPVGAIKFAAQTPAQEGDSGYKVNLREKSWGELGYLTG